MGNRKQYEAQIYDSKILMFDNKLLKKVRDNYNNNKQKRKYRIFSKTLNQSFGCVN